jgi:Asp/Glu/hydantoin racemase
MTRRPTVLLINPNTSRSVTDRLAAEAIRVAAGAADIRGVTAPFGAAAIQTPDELTRAEDAVAACIEEHKDVDAAVIGGFGDPGLYRARTIAAYPIFGLGRSGICAAGAERRRFSIITVGSAMRADVLAMIEDTPVAAQFAALHFMTASVMDVVADRDKLADTIVETASRVSHHDRAGAILLGGGPFVGMAAMLAPLLPIPIIDGMAAAIHNAIASTQR